MERSTSSALPIVRAHKHQSCFCSHSTVRCCCKHVIVVNVRNQDYYIIFMQLTITGVLLRVFVFMSILYFWQRPGLWVICQRRAAIYRASATRAEDTWERIHVCAKNAQPRWSSIQYQTIKFILWFYRGLLTCVFQFLLHWLHCTCWYYCMSV